MPSSTRRTLARDPNARVAVFVDGQNLYQACRRTFGHPHCHPHLLAEFLAGPRIVNPVACRFYTGRPRPDLGREEAIKARNLDRRLEVMRTSGVTVVTRPLHYSWTWGHSERLPKPSRNSAERWGTVNTTV